MSRCTVRLFLALVLISSALVVSACKKSASTGGFEDSKTAVEGTRNQAAAQEKAPAQKTETAQPATAATESDSTDDAQPVAKKVSLKTNLGEIVIELDSEKAPKSVANFSQYVRSGFYNGTIFHRVIDRFMIQGGGFDAQFQRKQTREPIQNEADNGLKNDRGTVAMARTGDPHSATAQFFINTKNNGFLNHSSKTMRGWGYTVFGRVISGMDTVNKISKTKTGAKGPFPKDVPQTDIVIESATVIE